MNPYIVIKKIIDDASPIIEKYGSEITSQLPELDGFLDKQATHIMVYGAYNAGKSTLIDALLGEEKAPIGDIPTTDSVSRYMWNGFEILDTPGINAPIEHEQITEEQTKRCSLMLFVVREGDLDAKDVYQRLFDMLHRDKKIFIVLNHQLSSAEDKAHVLARIQRNLFDYSKNSGLSMSDDALKGINICLVNAKTALKARLEEKAILLDSSGFNELEMKLLDWIKFNDTETRRLEHAKGQVNEILFKPLLVQMDKSIVTNNASAEQIGMFRDRKAHFNLQMSKLRLEANHKIAHFVRAKKGNVEKVLTDAEISDYERERQLQTMFEPLGEELNNWLQEELDKIFAELTVQLGKNSSSCKLQDQLMIQLDASFNEYTESESGVISTLVDTFGSTLSEKITKADNIKSGLLFLRKMKVPFFKGRWESTLGKWAVRAGPAIQVILGLWDAYKSAKKENEYNRQLREYQISVAREVENVCELVSGAMLSNIDAAILEIETRCIRVLSTQITQLEHETGLFNQERHLLDQLMDRVNKVGYQHA